MDVSKIYSGMYILNDQPIVDKLPDPVVKYVLKLRYVWYTYVLFWLLQCSTEYSYSVTSTIQTVRACRLLELGHSAFCDQLPN